MSTCTTTCMPPGGLCSEIRSCQAPAEPLLPPDAKTSGGRDSSAQSYWNSLQTFSFARWCSRLLPDILSSGTSFAAFLKTTLHTSRSDIQAPAKALFPLPFPKFGLFASRSSRQSSRARRRLAFDQAFHAVIAALNFLHADCSFPPLDMLVRIPSASQQQALWNLRRIFKAFGNSEEEFLVPKSGRRSTNLVSGLCDLSEFLTRSGAAGSSYFHGFAGDPGFGGGEPSLHPNLSRAEELIPYNSQEKLTGILCLTSAMTSCCHTWNLMCSWAGLILTMTTSLICPVRIPKRLWHLQSFGTRRTCSPFGQISLKMT